MAVVYLFLLVGPIVVEAGPAPSASSGFHKPVPYTGLSCPALVQEEEELGPTSPLYAMFF